MRLRPFVITAAGMAIPLILGTSAAFAQGTGSDAAALRGGEGTTTPADLASALGLPDNTPAGAPTLPTSPDEAVTALSTTTPPSATETEDSTPATTATAAPPPAAAAPAATESEDTGAPAPSRVTAFQRILGGFRSEAASGGDATPQAVR